MINKTGDWYDREKKRAAIIRVIRYIIANPDKGKECVGHGNDMKAHALFKDPTIGNIQMPEANGARAIVFATGEVALKAGGSVIIELPPPEITPASNLTDDQVVAYAINYVHWLNLE